MCDDRKLKILHIAGWYPSQTNPAVGTFIREHVKASALYNNVVVICSEKTEHAVSGLYVIEDEIDDGIRTLRVKYRDFLIPKVTSMFIFLGIFHAFNKLRKEGFVPDVLHAHIYEAGIPAVILGKCNGIPVIITEHSSAFPRKLIRGINRLMARFAFEHANLVCPVSNDLMKHIEAYGIRANFRVIPNVVDTSLFVPRNRTEREHNKKRLLLVAMLTDVKGVPYLIEALKILRTRRSDFVLDIIGDGPRRHEYEMMVKRLGLNSVVRFYGFKPKHDVAEFMRNADVFVLPSLWENLPCVIIEAMASGLPVVATNVGGIPEIVNNEVGVLVPPRDADALAHALDSMLQNINTYSSQKIAAYAAQRFSYEVVGKILTDLYNQVLGAARDARL